jgi:hypothetical protein
MHTSKQEIERTCENLKLALIARFEADKIDTEHKLEITRTHNELLLAKGEVDAIKFN